MKANASSERGTQRRANPPENQSDTWSAHGSIVWRYPVLPRVPARNAI
jgi:hypothetical protein